ncbi:DUF7344 domain-containing protein [Haladaptatus sp. NG-SE-30]
MSTKEREEANASKRGDVPAESDRPVTRDVSLSLDTTFEILANRERRKILGYLSEIPGRTATVDELTELLRRTDESTARPTDDPSITLVHAHLPKLADVGVIEYENRIVRYRQDDRLDEWLSRIRTEKTN